MAMGRDCKRQPFPQIEDSQAFSGVIIHWRRLQDTEGDELRAIERGN